MKELIDELYNTGDYELVGLAIKLDVAQWVEELKTQTVR